MSLNVKDPEAHRLAQAIAEVTGESLTRAVGESLRERYLRIRLRRTRPAQMIVDTSALVAILYGEPEGVRFAQAIHDAETCSISVASFVELSMVVEKQIGADAARQVDALFRRIGLTIEPVTVDQGLIARQAFIDFGTGRHRAGLNFGDCFSYAPAKAKGESLLFKGGDFGQTDIASAI